LNRDIEEFARKTQCRFCNSTIGAHQEIFCLANEKDMNLFQCTFTSFFFSRSLKYLDEMANSEAS
jgi:hypothetical protein